MTLGVLKRHTNVIIGVFSVVSGLSALS